jgi:hypothetical protein
MVALYTAVYARQQAMRHRKGKQEMKHMKVVGLMVVILAAARIAGAQVLNRDVGVPLGSGWNPGGAIVLLKESGVEDQVTPIGAPTFFVPTGFTSTFAGDLILSSMSNLGGYAPLPPPSDWLADIRFFNPLDPTGTLGLPATETEAFFPADFGPNGFDTFQLMPDYNWFQGSANSTETGIPGTIEGGEVVFGPNGGILNGQEAIFNFDALPGAQAASTPEPGALALLLGVGIVGAGLLVRRRSERKHTP